MHGGDHVVREVRVERDAAGRVITETVTNEAPPEVAGIGTYWLEHRLVSWNGDDCRHDLDGNLTARGSDFAATYDDEGHLTSVTIDGEVWIHRHDALGRLVCASGSGSERWFVRDLDGQLLAEVDPSGSLLVRHVWRGSTPVARVDANGVTRFLHLDHRANG